MGTSGADETRRHIGEVEQQLVGLARLLRAADAAMARELHPDLEPSGYGLLARVSETGGARVTDLAAHYGIGKPTVSRQVALLERLGLVARAADPADARASVIELTPLGAERLAAVRRVRRDRLLTLLGEWPDHDIGEFARLLGRFNDLVR